MTSPGQTANDAWEAMLTAHAVLMKQFAAEDIWEDLTMREYDVLYTLSKCHEPLRLGELHRHVLLTASAVPDGGPAHRARPRRAQSRSRRRPRRPPVAHGSRAVLAAPDHRRHTRTVTRAMTGALDAAEMRQLEEICRKLAAHGQTSQPSEMRA